MPDVRENQFAGDDMIEHSAKRARTEAHSNIQNQADKMVARSTRSLRGLAIGDNIAVPVSQFDKSKGDPPNLIGVVQKRDPDGYTIGTRADIIRDTLARNQIEFVKFSGLKGENVPAEHYTVRELVRKQSICGGQGYVRCHCHTNCLTKRCSCLKKGLRCNSAYHSHKSCDNVDK